MTGRQVVAATAEASTVGVGFAVATWLLASGASFVWSLLVVVVAMCVCGVGVSRGLTVWDRRRASRAREEVER